MTSRIRKGILGVGALALAALSLAGCGQRGPVIDSGGMFPEVVKEQSRIAREQAAASNAPTPDPLSQFQQPTQADNVAQKLLGLSKPEAEAVAAVNGYRIRVAEINGTDLEVGVLTQVDTIDVVLTGSDPNYTVIRAYPSKK